MASLDSLTSHFVHTREPFLEASRQKSRKRVETTLVRILRLWTSTTFVQTITCTPCKVPVKAPTNKCAMSPQPTGGNYHGMCRPHGVVLNKSVHKWCHLSIKVINPTKKTESKMFILRNIELQCFTHPEIVYGPPKK